MPKIDTIRTTPDPNVLEVLLTKDRANLGLKSTGELFSFSSKEEAEASAKAKAAEDKHRRGSWESPATTTRGKGPVPVSVLGQWLVASETSQDGPPTWSEPYHAGDIE